MKITKIVLACSLAFSLSNAENIMSQSMSLMEAGVIQIQKGFLNNNTKLLEDGISALKKGNALFTDKDTILKYLPENKKHLINVASTASERLSLDINVLELNLDNKAYLNATAAYSDILNACSRCHSIVRNW